MSLRSLIENIKLIKGKLNDQVRLSETRLKLTGNFPRLIVARSLIVKTVQIKSMYLHYERLLFHIHRGPNEVQIPYRGL